MFLANFDSSRGRGVEVNSGVNSHLLSVFNKGYDKSRKLGKAMEPLSEIAFLENDRSFVELSGLTLIIFLVYHCFHMATYYILTYFCCLENTCYSYCTCI